jgi:hypothetical protein
LLGIHDLLLPGYFSELDAVNAESGLNYGLEAQALCVYESTISAQRFHDLFDHTRWYIGSGQIRRAKHGFHHPVGMLFDSMSAFDHVAHRLFLDLPDIGDDFEDGKGVSARRICETVAR